MSHHFDYTSDERLDITEAEGVAVPGDAFGPRTVFGMNASPRTGVAWDPAGYYELRLDTNEDLVEDITWRFTFPVDSAGTQYAQVAELTGPDATDRNAPGRIITPPNAPVGEVLCLERGIKVFADPRTDSFFNFVPFPIAVTNAIADGTFPDTDPATGIWGQLRDQSAAVVAAGGTCSQGANGRPTALAYAAWVADTLLPNVLRFTPGTNALWDPWHGIQNGKGLYEDAGDNITRMVTNTDFTSGLTQPATLLDYFPYLSPPPAS
jgi:hypothetical protein